MNSGKLLGTGLTFIVGLAPALTVIGLTANQNVLVVVGAVLMIIGCILMWLDK